MILNVLNAQNKHQYLDVVGMCFNDTIIQKINDFECADRTE